MEVIVTCGVANSLVATSMGEAQKFGIGFDDPTWNDPPWAWRMARARALLSFTLPEQIDGEPAGPRQASA